MTEQVFEMKEQALCYEIKDKHTRDPLAFVSKISDSSIKHARLMAASPELLVALQVLMPAIPYWLDHLEDAGHKVTLEVTVADMKKAQAAINKALGTERRANGDV